MKRWVISSAFRQAFVIARILGKTHEVLVGLISDSVVA
jgi:hypothetical protein